jgi:hypothetical protein
MDLNDPEPVFQVNITGGSPPPPPTPEPATEKGPRRAHTAGAVASVLNPSPPVVHFASATQIPAIPLSAFQPLPNYEVDDSDSSSDNDEGDDSKCFAHCYPYF